MAWIALASRALFLALLLVRPYLAVRQLQDIADALEADRPTAANEVGGAPARWRFSRHPLPSFAGANASALLEQLQSEKGELQRHVREAVADIKRKAGVFGGEASGVKFLDKEEEEKISVSLLSELEFQQWERRKRRHVAYSWGEAKEFLHRRFKSAGNSTPEETLASLVQLEQGAGSREQAAFWRRQRKKLGQEAKGWDVLKPKVMAHVCVQVDVNLAFLSLPMVYLNLGIMGGLSYDLESHCWAWTAEVGIGLSGGIPIGYGVRLGIGVSLVGTWQLNEVTFKVTGLQASDYKLPTQCSVDRHPALTESGQQMCYTANPFMLIWHALQGVLARASKNIFPPERAKALLDKKMKSFRDGARTHLEVQTKRWEHYKSIFMPSVATAPIVGTRVLAVSCLSARYTFTPRFRVVFKPDGEGLSTKAVGFNVKEARVSKVLVGSRAEEAGVRLDVVVEKVNGTAYTRGMLANLSAGHAPFEVLFKMPRLENPMMSLVYGPAKELRCGLQVGSFTEWTVRGQEYWQGGFSTYVPDSRSIGGQFFYSAAGAPVERKLSQETIWDEKQRARGTVLMDDSVNAQVRVASWQHGGAKARRIEGVVKVDPSDVNERQNLTVPLGCSSNNGGDKWCIGQAELMVEPMVRRGRLSLKCTRASGITAQVPRGIEPFCLIVVKKSAVLGRSHKWRTSAGALSETRKGGSVQWNEGTSFGIYSPAGDDGPFPAAGPEGIAARVLVAYSDQEDAQEAGRKGWKDVFDDVDQVMSADSTQGHLLGDVSFTWMELLGPDGFARAADSGARVLKKRRRSRHSPAIGIEVVWTPEAAASKPASKDVAMFGGMDNAKLAEASSGIFMAASQLLAKFPKYAEQVLQRLMDDPNTDAVNSKMGVDCATKWREYGVGRWRQCPLLNTDGRSGARMHRQMDAEPDTVYREGEEARIVQDDRVMNLAKAARVSKRRISPRFWHDLSRSAANLFIRTVSDLQALFGVYFADEAQWDGRCSSLKPAFELPDEIANGEAKGRPMEWRYKPWDWSKAKQRELVDAHGTRLQRGAHIMTAGEALPEYEEETYNPWADHTFAYGPGYRPQDEKETARARTRFLTPDSPASGLNGNFYVEGDSSPTVITHLWCELAHVRAKKALSNYNKSTAPAAKEEQRRRGRVERDELLKSFVFGVHGAPRSDEGAGYADLVEEAIGTFDEDGDATLDIEEMTISFDEACIDTNCGDRSDCEKVRIKPAFVALFPSLMLTIRKYHQLLEARLTTAREVMQSKNEGRPGSLTNKMRKIALQSLELLRRWLKELGACTHKSKVQKEAMQAAGEDIDARRMMCQELEQKGGIISDDSEFQALRRTAQEAAGELDAELAPQEKCLFKDICYEKLTLLDNLAMDFHQAFAVQTRLPVSLQHTIYAQEALVFKGVLWKGLPLVRKVLWKDVTKVDNDKDQTVLGNLEREAEERLSRLASRLNPVAAFRLQFPLIETSFTLSLTFETATPGFCTPNAALLWLTWSVTGQTRSWEPDFGDMTRCVSAKVHPQNFAIRMDSCGVLKKGAGLSKRSKLKNLWLPSFNKKDRDVTVTMVAKLLKFELGGDLTSIFTSLDPQKKVLSGNFLAPVNEAITALPATAAAATNTAIASLVSGPFFATAMALTRDKDDALQRYMEEGGTGIVAAMQRLYKNMQRQAMESPGKPDSAVLNDPDNGEDWVEAEDPNRQPGEPFGVSKEEEVSLDFEDDHDTRHFKPHVKCNSLCGGRNVFVETQRRQGTAGEEFANNRRLNEKLRADQCISCKWTDSECDNWEVLDSHSAVYGSLCCTKRPCEEAPYHPGDALPWCMRADLNDTVAAREAAPNKTGSSSLADVEARHTGPELAKESAATAGVQAPCCNTACGATQFEDIDAAAGLLVRFDDHSFLGANECGNCWWQSVGTPCPKESAKQSHKGFKTLCCLKHTCGGGESAKPAAPSSAATADQPEANQQSQEVRQPKVERWERHPGCAAEGVARPTLWGGSKEDRIGGTECGVEAFGNDKAEYAFEDPKFLLDAQGRPSRCAQCIWKTSGTTCADERVRLQDGSIAERLEEQHASSWTSRFKLCCTKLDCVPYGDGSRSPRGSRSALMTSGLAQLGSTQAKQKAAFAPTIHWVMRLSGTRHIRHFSGTTGVPPSVDDATKVKRSFWTWEAQVEAWHYVEFPKIPLLGVQVAPVVDLNLDWDLTEVVAATFNGVLNASHQTRIQKCLECVKAGDAYCNEKYENPRYKPQEHEVCHEISKENAGRCNRLVTYDDHGNPTSPRFIVKEEECYEMKFRLVNEGYRRQYGAVSGFRNFRGNIHNPKEPLDMWGNSQDEKEGDEGDVTPSAVAAEVEEDNEEDESFTADHEGDL